MKNQDANLIEVFNIRIIRQLVSKDELKYFEEEGTKLPKEDSKSRARRVNSTLWVKIPNKERLKNNILKLLNRNNLPYTSFEKITGVTRQMIYAITNVNNHTRRSVIENIAQPFGVSAHDLLMTDL